MTTKFEKASDGIAEYWLQLIENTYDSQFESFSSFSQKLKITLREELTKQRDQVQRGYQIILDGLTYVGEDKSHYELSKERTKVLEDSNAVKKLLAAGKTYQEILDYTDDMTIKMYEVIQNIFSDKKFEDAAYALRFLTTLNPYVTNFWRGLANALEQKGDIEEALMIYEMPILLEPNQINHYVQAAQCLIAADNNYDRAKQLFEAAKNYAREENLPDFEKKIDGYLLHISQVSKKR